MGPTFIFRNNPDAGRGFFIFEERWNLGIVGGTDTPEYVGVS